MIYLDTSVALAHLLAEDRRPPEALWSHPLVSSQLITYELWARIHARGLAESHGELVQQLIGRVSLLALIDDIVSRVRQPFPAPVRTLDALHLASLRFLQRQGVSISLASYDERLLAAARGMNVVIFPLP